MAIVLLIVGLVLFVSLVVVHEYGHFIAARRNGVEVEEFAIGFPPRVWGKKLKSGLLFSVNALPLGGFVRLKGEHDSDTEKGSFGAASLQAKVKIMLAGVTMNLLVAIALLTVLAALGMPKLFENQFTVASDTKVVKDSVLVGYVEPDSPAAKAGLRPTDVLLFIKTIECEGCDKVTTPITAPSSLRPATEGFAGQTVELGYERDGVASTTEVQLRSSGEVEESLKSPNPKDHKGYLGISPSAYIIRRSTWSAPVVAVGVSTQITTATLKGLGTALAGLVTGNGAKASEQVSGPVGIFVILKDGSLLGYGFMLMIIAVISLTLAIMNVLPIPALDGGRLFVTLLYRGIRKPLTQKAEEWIHGSGFALLMILFVLITIIDVRRFT